MLSCAEFADRLYDEDCRSALERSGPGPRDVAEHRGACDTCARAWLEAAVDLQALRDVLPPAPAALERRLRTQLSERAQPRSPLASARRLACWSAVGAAAALAAARALPPSFAELGLPLLALVGASLAFAMAAAREALRAIAR